jgi:hypothetical protein
MRVRPECPEDRDAVRRVVAAAFGDEPVTDLVRRTLELLRDRPEPLVLLEGSPAYYSRLGFRPGSAAGPARPSTRIPPAAFQLVALPAYESWMRGALVYPDAFWEHDSVGLRRPRSRTARPRLQE